MGSSRPASCPTTPQFWLSRNQIRPFSWYKTCVRSLRVQTRLSLQRYLRFYMGGSRHWKEVAAALDSTSSRLHRGTNTLRSSARGPVVRPSVKRMASLHPVYRCSSHPGFGEPKTHLQGLPYLATQYEADAKECGNVNVQQYMQLIAGNVKQLREKGLLPQTPPLDLNLHHIDPRDWGKTIQIRNKANSKNEEVLDV
ncbi:uncharacterized protein [Aphelocoma coerulescens]|uniref:uncharacterized protein isoform X2 n=1 Tax=Aphelocoma coerulescens TaxID=39617 RepID=UPI0036047FDB